MKFWDTSAVVPLLVADPASERLVRLLRTEGKLLVWWGTPVESASAIVRRERGGGLAPASANVALERLRELRAFWSEVIPSAKVRDVALRLVRTHPLRAADSLQLAAAIVAADDQPATLGFVWAFRLVPSRLDPVVCGVGE